MQLRSLLVKCLGPRLVPFFKTFALLYVIYPKQEASVGYSLFKCAPIVCLIGFVLMYGFRVPHKQAYARKVLLGLIFSCMGDACLVFGGPYFNLGIGFFAVAHMLYVAAFGCQPPALSLLPWIMSGIGAVWIYCFSQISTELRLIGAVYGFLLSLMIWRAAAQLLNGNAPIPWTSISRAFGATLFGISDAVLSVELVYGPGTKLAFLILPTYYAAQMCITVSVVDRKLASIKASSVLSQ
ncbi:uncharacterized protein DEA37_0000021 [Paragonimus westermani]|uniref:lysoplasmalogenase n=1 Tax=Paragonimus westermani TaxID=34504 RepID=A0A5J4P278_9TREM|nr:uncharacterized protein DEA37_0000021 [Paragonimus westermani]